MAHLRKNIFLFCSGIIFTATGFSSPGIVRTKEPYNSIEEKDVQAKIVVDLSQKGSTVGSSFYGSHLNSYSKPPAAKLVSDLGISHIRIGGNEYDVFNWQNNLSYPKNGIRKLPSLVETAATLNSYKTTGIYQVNLHGYQPEMQGKNYVLKKTFNAKSAYEMIKTLNGKLQLNITHISLGNEPEQWHETHPHTKEWNEESGISADEYIARYIEFAIAIRQAQADVTGDPNSIKLWGPEISSSWLDWNTGNFDKDCKWSPTVSGQVNCSYGNGAFTHFIPYFLDRLAKAEKDTTLNPQRYKLLDYFAFHYYPNFRRKISDINSIIIDSNGRQWVAKMLEATRVLHDSSYINTVDLSSYKNMSPNIIGRMQGWLKAHYPDAKLAINEFAIDSDYTSTNYHPIVRPLYIADTVGIAASKGVSFFNNFILNTDAGYILPWTMINGNQPTNVFYTYALFTNNFKGTVVNAEDNMGDVVNSYAAETLKHVNLAVVNKNPIDRKVQIFLKNGNTRKVATYVIPGWSTSILTIEKSKETSSTEFDVQRYGAKEMGIPLDRNYAN